MPERLKVDEVAVEKWHELAGILTRMGVLTTGDGEAVEHWPVAVTAADRQRAAALLAGSRWPDALQLLPQTTED